MSFETSFYGHLDYIDEELARGWVASQDDKDQQALVTLWVDNRIAVQSRASKFRPDLEQLGYQHGYCAFEIEIPRKIKSQVADSVLRIEVSAGGVKADLYKGSFKRAENSLSEDLVGVMSDACERALEIFEDLQGELQAVESGVYPAINVESSASPVAKMYEEYCDSSGVYKPSKFLVYTRDLMNDVRRFDLEGNLNDADELLIWYLESYGAQRKPLRVPLSASDIERSNQIVSFPRCRFTISRMHHSYLLKNKKDLVLFDVLNNPDLYMNCVFSWVAHTCIELNAEDVLIPSSYNCLMNAVPSIYKGEKYPLNNFLVCYVNDCVELSELDVNNEAHRVSVLLIVLLRSIERPSLMNFIPEVMCKELCNSFSSVEDGLLQRIIRKILSSETLADFSNRDILRDLGDVLQDRKYCLANRSFTTIDTYGNRCHFNGSRETLAAGLQASCVVQLIGPLNKSSGLGQATRLSGKILEAAGYTVNYVDFDLDNPSPIGFNKAVVGVAPTKARINLIHINAEALPLLAAYYPDILADSYNIGYFFWELNSPARCHSLAIDMVDEIWVSSEFGVDQYQPYCDIPVSNVGMSYEQMPELSKCTAREHLNKRYSIEKDATVYLSTFDSYSYIQRKNPRGLIAAFQKAFQNGECVHLIVKTQNKDLMADIYQDKIWSGITAAIDNDSRITLINETIDYESLMYMKKGVDCYVSLHRSEGWGFGIIESMGLNVPVVASGFSGNAEFCLPETSRLVSGSKKYLSADDYVFVEPGQFWFEPDVDKAVHGLRAVYDNPEASTEKAKHAKRLVEEKFSISAIGDRYRTRLEEILKTDSRQIPVEGC